MSNLISSPATCEEWGTEWPCVLLSGHDGDHSTHYPRALFALIEQWGEDAKAAGLDRDTLTTDREAVRAIRDAIHAAGIDGGYRVKVVAISNAWLRGYDA